MAIDSPAKLTILGAGPIGLEAALYARFLGYQVDLLERADVASNVGAWRHITMFTPFEKNSTPLALAALEAQGDYRPPDPAARLTGAEYLEGYLLPLSKTDLLDGCIYSHTRVLQIHRHDEPSQISNLHNENDSEETEHKDRFSILACDQNGNQQVFSAAAVIDATGTDCNGCGLGAGGEFAEGQRENQDRIDAPIPDLLAGSRDRYEGKRLVVIGSDPLAAVAAELLVRLCSDSPQTKVTWLVPTTLDQLSPVMTELLSNIDEPAKAARNFEVRFAAEIRSVGLVDNPSPAQSNDCLEVVASIGGAQTSKFVCDRIVACTGGRADDSLWHNLNVRSDALTVDEVSTPEPNFYVIGSKRFGRTPGFLLNDGYRHIRRLFAILGDRPELDLYSSIRPLG